MLCKKLLERIESPMPFFSILSRWKAEKYSAKKKKLWKHLIIILLILASTEQHFQNYIHYDGPCLSTINLTDLELEDGFVNLKTNKSSGYDDISTDIWKKYPMKYLLFWNIFFQDLLAISSNGNLPRKTKNSSGNTSL